MSKQTDWQKKKLEQGLCKICGKPRIDRNKQFCLRHRELNKALAKKYRDQKRGLTESDQSS
jgi:hypothetical protein